MKIKNYVPKMWNMLRRQTGKCGLCGEKMNVCERDGYFYDTIKNQKVDFCHDFPRTKKNVVNYPLLIDSEENGVIGHNSCNVRRLPLNYKNGKYNPKDFLTYFQAEELEKKMREGKK